MVLKIGKRRQPGTIHNSLNSLQNFFYQLILCNKRDGMYAEDCNAIMARVWKCSSVHKGRVKKAKTKEPSKANRKFSLVTCTKRTRRIQSLRSHARVPACHQKGVPYNCYTYSKNVYTYVQFRGS